VSRLRGRKRRGSVTRDRCCDIASHPAPISGTTASLKAAALVELTAEKGASSILMPVSTRRDALNVSDEIAAKVDVRFYADARDAFIKAIAD
jgi:predicted ATP-dependent Lon-type protease